MSEKYKHELPGQYLYDNMLLCESFPVDNVLRVQGMELDPSDVVVASYPKTGTTLLQEVVWLIRNNGDTEKADETLTTVRVPFIEMAAGDNFQAFADLPHPRHMKTHLPYSYLPKTVREGKAKVVYIARNPKDCLVSFYHFHRMNLILGRFKGTWEEFFDYFKENDYLLLFGNPFDHMRQYWERKDDENLHIIFFEDIVSEPKKIIADLAKFLDCQLSDEILDTIVKATKFDAMKSNAMVNQAVGTERAFDISISPFMRKGKIGDWKNYFTEEQNGIIDEMEKEKLSGTGLSFVYE